MLVIAGIGHITIMAEKGDYNNHNYTVCSYTKHLHIHDKIIA